MSRRAWTPELIDELKRLRRRGHSYGEIAKRLGVTRTAALGKAMRLGLSVRVVPRRGMAMPEPAPLGGVREILDEGCCHCIAGEIGAAWRMCGHRSVHGSSWCPHHLGRVYDEAVSIAPPVRRDAP